MPIDARDSKAKTLLFLLSTTADPGDWLAVKKPAPPRLSLLGVYLLACLLPASLRCLIGAVIDAYT